MRRIGFTLAEVLITVGVIGVVAALTIPTLMNNAQNKANNEKFKKSYSELANVVSQIANENGGSMANAFSSYTDLQNAFGRYYKTSRFCHGGDETACLATTFNYLNGSSNWPYNTGCSADYAMFVTITGETINLCNFDYTCPDNICTTGTIIDVNGPKEPNTMGKDVFYVEVQANRIKPRGYECTPEAISRNCSTEATNWISCDGSSNTMTGLGSLCAAKVIMGNE